MVTFTLWGEGGCGYIYSVWTRGLLLHLQCVERGPVVTFTVCGDGAVVTFTVFGEGEVVTFTV